MAVRREAARWVDRRRDDKSEATSQEFVKWLDAAPIHIEEFLHAKATAELIKLSDPTRSIAFADLAPKSDVIVLRDRKPDTPEVDKHDPPRRTHSARSTLFKVTPAMAAAVAIAFGAIWIRQAGVHTYSTELGEQRTVRLADGSMIELNTRTRVSVDYSEHVRAVRLLQGEAFFSVAHHPTKPFRVFAGKTVVEAVGTQFSVRRETDSSTRVAVVEGRVQVAQASTETSHSLTTSTASPADIASQTSGHFAKPALLVADEEANVAGNGTVIKTAHPNVRREVAWREHRLTFDNDTISEVVSQFSRYSDAKIVLEGDVGMRRISGICSLDPDSLLAFLESDESLTVQRTPGGAVVRSR